MHDIKLELAFGGRGRNLGKAKNVTISWPDLVKRLSNPERDTITMAEYLALDKDSQSTRKSVGFYTGGPCIDGKRDASHMLKRSLVMLDCDNVQDITIYEAAKLNMLPNFGYEALVHSTRKHTDDVPRLRIAIPLSRQVDHIEFVAVSRILASLIDQTMETYDPASFSMAQIMYLPSVCSDVDYFCEHIPGDLADPDAILAAYSDWMDIETLPHSASDLPRARDPQDVAMDPRKKTGIVGAFCRKYSITSAMREYLPYFYEPVRGQRNRYTYTGGSTSNGAIVYDDLFLYSHHSTDPCGGRLVNAWDMVRIHLCCDMDEGYSGPIKDAPSQRDMIHLAMKDADIAAEVERERAAMRVSASDFDVEDDDTEADAYAPVKPVSDEKEASMAEERDPLDDLINEVSGSINLDSTNADTAETSEMASVAEFDDEDGELGVIASDVRAGSQMSALLDLVRKPHEASIPAPANAAPAATAEEDPDRMPNVDVLPMLQRNQKGNINVSTYNIGLILQNDVRFSGKIRWSEMLQHPVVVDVIDPMIASLPAIPMQDRNCGDIFAQRHSCILSTILDAPPEIGGYGITAKGSDIETAVINTSFKSMFHPIRAKLDSLIHDGKNRIDTLFIDYFGAEDSDYHRAVSRIWLIGAVARIYEPGMKFDFVPILEGAQGRKKSSFSEALAMGFFTEIHKGDFSDDKKLVERLSGAWIAEVPELSAISPYEMESVKALISSREDKIRPSYARWSEKFPRQSVFIGTINKSEYLLDESGNRRFWPVKTSRDADISKLRIEVEQIWAEAVVEYRRMRAECTDIFLPLFMADTATAARALEVQESRRVIGVEDENAGVIDNYLMTVHGTTNPAFEEWQYERITTGNRNGYILRTFCLRQIWVAVMGKEMDSYGKAEQASLSTAIRRSSVADAIDKKCKFREHGFQRTYVSKLTVSDFAITDHDE